MLPFPPMHLQTSEVFLPLEVERFEGGVLEEVCSDFDQISESERFPKVDFEETDPDVDFVSDFDLILSVDF